MYNNNDLDICATPAERCPTIQLSSNSEITTRVTDVGTVVDIVCKNGFINNNHVKTLPLECTENKVWNGTAPECNGEFETFDVN